jgi:hypothetical protein
MNKPADIIMTGKPISAWSQSQVLVIKNKSEMLVLMSIYDLTGAAVQFSTVLAGVMACCIQSVFKKSVISLAGATQSLGGIDFFCHIYSIRI